MPIEESPKTKLKLLRDKLAAAAPRARTRAGSSGELVRRLESAVAQVGKLYLLVVAKGASDAVGEAVDDALVEGHLLLHELDKVPEQVAPPKAKPPLPLSLSLSNRRQHERHEINVTVRLLRHSVHQSDTGGVSLTTETTSRTARNVSCGGIFVALPQGELTQVGIGSVVHVQVGTVVGGPAFHARAIVMRRDAAGLGLSWVQDSERVRRDIATLLEAVRRAAQPTAI